MADKITIDFDFHAAKALADIAKSKKELKELEESWSKASDAEKKAALATQKLTAWKVLAADFDKLGESIEKTNPRLLRFGQGIANVAGGVATGAVAIAGLGAALVTFAAHAEQTEAQVNRLGAAYDEVARQTNGAMSASQALTLQGQIQASGVRVNSQQLGLLARAAREYAVATGNDASEAVEKLTNAIVNNSEDALSELGLAQARATTSTQTLANMTRELEQRFRGVAPTARSLKEDLDKIPDALTAIGGRAMQGALTALEELANRFSSTGRAGSEFFRNASRGWRDIVEAGDTMRGQERQQATDASNADRQLAREQLLARARTAGVQISQNDIRGLSAAQMRQLQSRFEMGLGVTSQRGRGADLEAAFGSQAMVGSAQTLFDAQLNRIAIEQRQAERDAERRAGTIVGVRLTEMEAGIERKLRKPRGDGGSGSSDLRNAIREYQRAVAEMPEGAVQVLPSDMPQNPGESATQYYTRLAGIQQGFNSAGAASGDVMPAPEEMSPDKLAAAYAETRAGAQRDRDLQQRRFARDRETRRMAVEQDRSVGGGIRRGLGVTGDAMETQARMTQGYADTIVGAYGKIGDAITRHIELVASGQETLGQALLNGVHEVTKALAMEALPKALMETAAGFAALANPLTAATAPLHFTAAGVYGAVAAGAGLVAGVTGALGAGQSPQAGAGARATGAARAASGMSSQSSTERGSPVTIVLSSIVPPGPGELQRLVDAGSQAGRYNLDRRRDMVPRQVRA